MYALRARFKKDIVAEFLPPYRVLRKLAMNRRKPDFHDPKAKVIILCDGMPGMPNKMQVMEFFSKKGYWVFHPRYRGAWESGGEFLKESPHEDILDIIDELPKHFRSAYDGQEFALGLKKVYVVGASFGGAAALLTAIDERVDKIVAFSPVTNWTKESKIETVDWMYGFVKEGFGMGYRVRKRNWNKLKSGSFFNPWNERKSIPGNKVLIVHPQDDEVVYSKHSKRLAKITKSTIFTPKYGGHMGMSKLITPLYYKKFLKHIK